MKHLLQIVPLRKPSLLQRLFRQQPDENAIIEVNNLLASMPLMSIKRTDITNISTRYNLNLNKIFKKNVYEFYAVYLKACLQDNTISDEEAQQLDHLASILGLTEKDREVIQENVAGPIFQNAVESAVANGRLSDSDWEYFDTLQQQIRLPDTLADTISANVREKYFRSFMDTIVSSERLSPKDDQELEAIKKSLQITVSLDSQSIANLNKFRTYWEIENGQISPIPVDINLQRNEACYFSSPIDWYEQRTITQRVDYGGPVARLKIMKGVYFRVGSVSARKVTSEEWRHIDSGTLYLTNKRILFMGSKKNTNIRLDKVLSFIPYTNGIEINKEIGRSPFLAFNSNVDIVSLMISRFLKEN